MKTLKLTILFLLFPLTFFAQSLTGLWMGSISNDSTTVRRDQSFEIVLTQYREKVYGYSRSTFIVNDSLFYIVKRVKGTIEGDVCEVKDDDIISYNFHGRLDKGVKMISTFRFDQQDSVWRMEGDWKTNKTKKYYSLSGKIDLKAEKNFDQSKIFPHLEELKLADDVTFYKESKKIPEPVTATRPPAKNNKQDHVVKEEKPITVTPKETKKEELAKAPAKSEPIAEIKQATKDENREPILKVEKLAIVSKNEMKKEDIVTPSSVVKIKEPAKSEPTAEIKQVTKDASQATILKVEKPAIVSKKEDIVTPSSVVKIKEPVKSDPAIETKQPVKNIIKEPATVSTKDIKKEEENIPANPVEQKKEVVTRSTNTETKKTETPTVAITPKEKDQQSIVANTPELKPLVKPAAALIAERKMVATQIVNYKSDSLLLSLYDNGEVDGDTVSVLLNGEVILARQGLKASAIKKTIYIPAGKDDSLTLVLYAENLGKYPPNTGLLVVHDGDDVYQIRFTADLQQNATVIFKRKRN